MGGFTRDIIPVPSVCTTAHSIRNSIETKAENNRLEAKQYPAIQRNLTENTIDCGTRSYKTPYSGHQNLKIVQF
jgi:hypothetical protein